MLEQEQKQSLTGDPELDIVVEAQVGMFQKTQDFSEQPKGWLEKPGRARVVGAGETA